MAAPPTDFNLQCRRSIKKSTMVSPTALFAITFAAVTCISIPVNGHGYMTIPEAVPLAKHKKDKMISSWIVQIEPQFKADWNSIGNDDDLIALYVEKAKENGYDKDIRKLLDSDTNLYGADCGYSDPNATPKTPPSDGTATFSRGIAHHGPCEIWVGDKMALHDDDCAKTFGAEDYMSIKSVFKPIDYSSCPSSGCMFRFYWLAFQGSDNGYVWQIYKHCVPLTGPPAGQASTATASSGSTASNTTQSEAETEAPDAENQTPEVTQATVKETSPTSTTTEKCNAPRRRT